MVLCSVGLRFEGLKVCFVRVVVFINLKKFGFIWCIEVVLVWILGDLMCWMKLLCCGGCWFIVVLSIFGSFVVVLRIWFFRGVVGGVLVVLVEGE